MKTEDENKLMLWFSTLFKGNAMLAEFRCSCRSERYEKEKKRHFSTEKKKSSIRISFNDACIIYIFQVSSSKSQSREAHRAEREKLTLNASERLWKTTVAELPMHIYTLRENELWGCPWLCIQQYYDIYTSEQSSVDSYEHEKFSLSCCWARRVAHEATQNSFKTKNSIPWHKISISSNSKFSLWVTQAQLLWWSSTLIDLMSTWQAFQQSKKNCRNQEAAANSFERDS